MIGKLLDFKDYLKDVVKDIGGIKVFIIALVITIVAFPFMMLYYLIIEPLYKMIRILTDAPKLGIKRAYMKYFNSEQFDKERRKMEEEEKKALDSRLLPDSRQKRFKDWEDWPNAYVVDKVAVYAAGGRTLLYVDERVEEFDLPDNLRVIDTEAFRRCFHLERIDTNEKLEVIEERAFEDCYSLKEFIMPEPVKSCTVGMFNGCHSLQHIHLSSNIKDFGGSCCRDCWSINQITMPINEKLITYAKKRWKEYAEKVDITTSEKPVPESMFWTMEDALFFGIPRLSTVCLMFCFSKDNEYTIPSFVTNIKRDAFTSCKNLRTLRLSPFIKASDDPWEPNNISYDFIYEYWPQIENIVFDETLKNTKYAFGLRA